MKGSPFDLTKVRLGGRGGGGWRMEERGKGSGVEYGEGK